jgi:phosphotransferase system enzyme I (PtsI)
VRADWGQSVNGRYGRSAGRMIERRLSGIAAADGVAEGSLHLLANALVVDERRISAAEIAAELERFDRAVDTAEERFVRVAAGLQSHGNVAAVELVTAYRMMLRSPEILLGARRRISDQADGAEWAVRQAIDDTRATFEAFEDAYMRERAGDVQAVGEQLLRALLGLPDEREGEGAVRGSIAVAFDLSPLEVVRLAREGTVGLVTETGGRTSHAAILARSLGLPFVAGVVNACVEVPPDSRLLLDGRRGVVVVNPSPTTTVELRRLDERSCARKARLATVPALPAVTIDGIKVGLFANIEALEQIPRAIAQGAQGVGLFRTEFLYLDRPDLPSEEEQFEDACAALRALTGRPATFRTLDLGGDKLPLSVRIPEGHNPALGVRSIRFSFRRPDIFRTQLRALFRAGAHGPMRIMFPLISGVTDLHEARKIVDEVKTQLRREHVAHDPSIPVGVMIETPSAALTADHLARHCDFLSIGTNDLMQYAFAADRDNRDVANLYHPLHPAVLRLIKLVIEAAAAAGKPVSLCGDMASVPLYTMTLLGLGLRDFSLEATALADVKAVVRACRLDDARALADRALGVEDESDGEALATQALALALPGDD